MRASIFALLLSLLLSACGGEPAVEVKDRSSKNALSPQIDSLEKAKQVERLLKENEKKRRLEMQKRGA